MAPVRLLGLNYWSIWIRSLIRRFLKHLSSTISIRMVIKQPLFLLR